MLGGEEAGGAGMALTEEMVDEEAVETSVGPFLIGHVGEAGDFVEFGEMGDSGGLLGVECFLFRRQLFQFPLEIRGFGQEGVESG